MLFAHEKNRNFYGLYCRKNEPVNGGRKPKTNFLNGVIEYMINVRDQKLGQNLRKSFSRSKFDYPLPNLVEIQTKSYEWFKNEGLQEVLRDASPIEDHVGSFKIEFISYRLEENKPNYPVEECLVIMSTLNVQLKEL